MSYLARLEEVLKTHPDREAVFKTRGTFKLGTLFLERFDIIKDKDEGVKPLYTLRDTETTDCIPLRKLYLEIADPTEYEFANKCFHSYKHFKFLMELSYFKKFIDDCRDELELKLRSEAVLKIRDEALKGAGSSAITASKFLIERNWIGNKKEKEALIRRSKQDKEINSLVEDDLRLLETKVETA